MSRPYQPATTMKKQSRENCPECLSLSPGLSCQSSTSVQRSPGFLKATIVPDSCSMTIVESRKACLRLARRFVSLSGFSLVKLGSRVSFTFAFSNTINFIFPSPSKVLPDCRITGLCHSAGKLNVPGVPKLTAVNLDQLTV